MKRVPINMPVSGALTYCQQSLNHLTLQLLLLANQITTLAFCFRRCVIIVLALETSAIYSNGIWNTATLPKTLLWLILAPYPEIKISRKLISALLTDCNKVCT